MNALLTGNVPPNDLKRFKREPCLWNHNWIDIP